ncbi:hypothetical protein V496_06519 [Pseudogymnoascus sp. VKM F-4515 (FW-2607)]|nr:hypothetical protein V496_06519 [Pseudogymnoascus sp. VKM F-4515 (FW-2607)]KFY91388.1 hypothetical protein V498_05472 [Pseudogymnoascus sp. VKM F-4517 (FW-2822)]
MVHGVACLNDDYVNKFFEPQFSSIVVQNILRVEDDVQIAWFGGKGNRTPVQAASLSLYLHNSEEHIAIVDVGLFEFGDSPTSNWTYFDQCGNTKLSYNWTIPGHAILVSAFDLGPYPTFEFRVSNGTTEFRSLGFSIELVKADSSTSTINSASTFPIGSPTSLNKPISTSIETIDTGSTGLSTGAKAGIGSGCGVAGLLFFFGVIIYVRRRRTQSSLSHNQGTYYDKPELSGDGVSKQAMEIAGKEIHEMDSQAKRETAVELSAPIEIHLDKQV